MPPAKTLHLYRLHSADCKVHKLKLKPELKRVYRGCQCTIYMYGHTPNGLVVRQSTRLRDWNEAEKLRLSLLQQQKDESLHGPTVEDCINRYIDSRQHELGEKTAMQYRLVLERLRKFCDERHVRRIQELNVDLLEDFKTYGLKNLKPTSKATQISKLRAFLGEAYRREWIGQPLVLKLRPYRAHYEQKTPFTDEEVQQILQEALKLKGGTHGYAKRPKTFHLLLRLMLETGLRVSDAIRFDPSSMERGKYLWIYSFHPKKSRKDQKTKTMEVFLTDDLKKEIDSCEWLSSLRPFAYGNFRNDSYLCNQVYERMQEIGRRCGVKDCRPHRLRDTFAVRKLLSGLSMDDVSKLLGHSSVRVTEAYYANWVLARKMRLEKLVADTLPGQALVDSQGNASGN